MANRRTLIQAVYAATIAAALSVGAAQALASPAGAGSKAAVCYPGACYRECMEYGYRGSCVNGACVCWTD